VLLRAYGYLNIILWQKKKTSHNSSGNTEMKAVLLPVYVQLIRLTSKNTKPDTTVNPVKTTMYSVFL